MAKGDKGRHQSQIDTQQKLFQPGMNNLQNTLQGSQNTFMNNYNTGVGKNMGSYDEIMNLYKGIENDARTGTNQGPGPGGFTPGTYTPQTYDYTDPFKSYSGYEEFARSGGLSAEDQANMRARGIAPTRAIYQNAIRGINRQKALQGGYSPNATAALAKNKREMSQQITDANIGVNSDIAKMVQQGKLAGLGGMYGIEGQRLGAEIGKNKYAADQKNWAEEQTGQDRRFGAQYNASTYRDPNDARLQALHGMTSLYGATPGMAQLFGNQVLQNQGQMGDAMRMQGDWGQNQIQNQFQNSQIPGNFGQFMNNVNSAIQPIANVGMGLTGMGNIWNMGRSMIGGGQPAPSPSTYVNPGGTTNYSRMYNFGGGR